MLGSNVRIIELFNTARQLHNSVAIRGSGYYTQLWFICASHTEHLTNWYRKLCLLCQRVLYIAFKIINLKVECKWHLRSQKCLCPFIFLYTACRASTVVVWTKPDSVGECQWTSGTQLYCVIFTGSSVQLVHPRHLFILSTHQ